MSVSKRYENMRTKPFLSIEEVAVQLGISRATLYRAVNEGATPFPVLTLGKRLKVPRRAVERIIDGVVDYPPEPDKQRREQVT